MSLSLRQNCQKHWKGRGEALGEVVSAAEAGQRCAAWRAAGRTVIFTNGHFDLLHLGHVDVLQRARALGDMLVVGLNSDASTRQLKGPQRPLVPETERAVMLAALACVDLVVIYEEPTANRLVAALRPHVYVKGGDWEPEQDREGPPEAAVARSYGGQVRFLPYLPGHSTSALIQTILDRFATQASSNPSDAS
ncbi:MAG: adenylyltransferase/cytidyltransferase family protein [Chloroflexi bacterium]|nr:adenylyltransferase/cytidyltransferase family protein [Chloroflexota bacterium]